MRAGVAVAALLLGATASAQTPPPPDDPELLMRQLETRLIAARRVTIEATIASEGFVTAKLAGKSELQERNRATVAYRGDFAGKPAVLWLTSDGRALEMKSGEQSRRETPGKESNRALLIGFVRMGLLPNLARLSATQPPEHAGGGLEEWVVLDAFRPTTYAQGGELEGHVSFGFDLLVAGEVVGSARLWLDPKSGLPRRRALTLVSLQGESRVVEDYTRFVVE